MNTTVLAFGTFDILHAGHLAYLRTARRLANRLIVVISRDATVRKIKGANPLFSEQERRSIIASLGIVDQAVLGSTSDYFRILNTIRPAAVCLGYDHAISASEIRAYCTRMGIPEPAIVRARAYQPARYNSTRIKERITTDL